MPGPAVQLTGNTEPVEMVKWQHEEAVWQIQNGDILQAECPRLFKKSHSKCDCSRSRDQSNQLRCINLHWPHKATVYDKLDNMIADWRSEDTLEWFKFSGRCPPCSHWRVFLIQSTGSQSWAKVDPQGCLKTFLIVTAGGGGARGMCHRHLVGRSQGCC